MPENTMNSEKLDVFEIKNEKLTFFHLQKKKEKEKKTMVM